MVRTKVVAILLGPAGVGLVGLYQSALGLVGIVAGLGIGQSAVREVAEAHGTGDKERVGRTIRVMRRTCWFSGLLGAGLTAALAWPISLWTFGSTDRVWAIALLGLTLLMGSISAGQNALIQGMRRIGDIARIQILSAIAGTSVSVGLYAWLGERGIVPALLLFAAVHLGISWWFARRVALPTAAITWPETAKHARRFISLGLAFMWGGLAGAGVAWVTRVWILRDFGMDANGIYQAAWVTSGLFAGFILRAMGMDFYPRLTAVAQDNQEVNRLVNEQTEVGMLLALPGLLGTLVFAPWIIRAFYTAQFLESAVLLPWFVLGIFGRVVSWPLGFIPPAKGAARWFAATETVFSGIELALVWVGLRWFGLVGAAAASAVLYVFVTIVVIWVAGRLSRFRWSPAVVRLLAVASILITGTFAVIVLTPPSFGMVSGGLITVATGFYCLRQITARVGPEHRISRMVARLPWIGQRLAP